MSKTQKRRQRRISLAKGGRPRMEGPREPNGRLYRTWRAQERERDACQTVREARQRVFGVSETDAAKHEAMTVLGRLQLQGSVSADQAEAARRYQDLRVRYQRAIAAPTDFREPAPEENGSGVNFEEWVSQTVEQHQAMMQALADVCMEVRSPAPKAALDVIVHRDMDMPELNGALRLALNALDRHFAGRKARVPEMAA